jgi:hypothetical protein
MKFDLTNLSDLIADPLSRLRLMKDYTQEALERILGDEKTPIKKAVVLEVIPPSPNANNNPKGSNEQYYAIRARIENMHESLPNVVEFIDQKRTNEEINKLIDIAKPIFSLNPVDGKNNTTPIPNVGDIVELIEVEKGIYRFNEKIGTVQKLVGFMKNEDPNSSSEPVTVDPAAAQAAFENGTEYDPSASGPASGGINDQGPVLAAAKAGDYHNDPKQGLPCTGYVAIWVLNQLGLIPQQSEWQDWKAWSRKDSELWKRINLSGYGQSSGDTTNIDFIQKRLGGSIKAYVDHKNLVKPGPGPELTAGRWHIAQKWRTDKSGHIYLIFWDGGDSIRILDSSHASYHKDYTLKKDSWWKSNVAIEKILTLSIGDTAVPTNTTGAVTDYDQDATIPNKSQHNPFLMKANPSFVPYIKRFIAKCWNDKKISISINSTYRDATKQQELIQKWIDGGKTGVRPSTTSMHLIGGALDFNPTLPSGKTLMKSTDQQTWEASGVPNMATSLGLRWGGVWSNYDPIHIDMKDKMKFKSVGEALEEATKTSMAGNKVSLE